MIKLRLQVRVTALITILSLLFISVFTFIQLRNHLERLTAYNRYRARVGAIIVKTTFEMLLGGSRTDESALPGIFGAAIESFSKEGIAEKISVLSMDGEAIATNDPIIEEFGETRKDIERYLKLSRESGKDAWFYSAINQKTELIDIYIPITSGTTSYLAKISFSIGNIRQAAKDILLPITLTAMAVILGNLFLGFVLLREVVWPIKVLNMATKDIASGNLDLRVRIKTNDEIQELGETFNDMTVALKKMKERAENANPLTKLPGNNVIRDEVEARIRRKEKFVAIHADLDNFKAYNDRYGIAKGDEVIKFTSKIMEMSVKEKGNPDDFIGHEGGDDFFLITTPDKAEAVADFIMTEFDSKIKGFYSKQDIETGYILERDRRGDLVKYPMMTISLAGVTNQFRPIATYGELTNIAVEVKHKAKEIKRSNFLIDRRISSG